MYRIVLIHILVALTVHANSQNLNTYEIIEKHICVEKKSSIDSIYKPSLKNIHRLPLLAYKILLSEQLSSKCEFHPSCSAFSSIAMSELGLIKGIFLTADRLTRCNGTALLHAPSYLYNNKTGLIEDHPSQYNFDSK